MCFASLVCGYLDCKSMGGELGVPTCIQVGSILIQQGGLMGCVKELDRHTCSYPIASTLTFRSCPNCLSLIISQPRFGRWCSRLQLDPARNKVAMDVDVDWEDDHSFGQKSPPLYVQIKEVLHEYPDGQVFKV